MSKSILLKCGTIKGWDGLSDKEVDILKEIFCRGCSNGLRTRST